MGNNDQEWFIVVHGVSSGSYNGWLIMHNNACYPITSNRWLAARVVRLEDQGNWETADLEVRTTTGGQHQMPAPNPGWLLHGRQGRSTRLDMA